MAIKCPSNILCVSGLSDFSSLTVVGTPLSLAQLCKHEYWQLETSAFSSSSATHFPLLLVFMLLSSFHLLQSFSDIFAFLFFSPLLKLLFHILLSMAVTIGNSWLKSRFAFWRARFSSGIPCMILLFLIFTNLSRHWPVLILYSYSSQIIFIKAWRCTSAFTHGTERKQLSVSCHIFS